MRSPALSPLYLCRGCHAVLALLSEGYPPLEGRSPTRYSPVCHSTSGLLHIRVRLACVRHAASVDSEPGSNSQVKFAVPARRRWQLVQPDQPVDMALGFILTAPKLTTEAANEGGRGRSSNGWLSARKRPHPLILDGLVARFEPCPCGLSFHRTCARSI